MVACTRADRRIQGPSTRFIALKGPPRYEPCDVICQTVGHLDKANADTGMHATVVGNSGGKVGGNLEASGPPLNEKIPTFLALDGVRSVGIAC